MCCRKKSSRARAVHADLGLLSSNVSSSEAAGGGAAAAKRSIRQARTRNQTNGRELPQGATHDGNSLRPKIGPCRNSTGEAGRLEGLRPSGVFRLPCDKSYRTYRSYRTYKAIPSAPFIARLLLEKARTVLYRYGNLSPTKSPRAPTMPTSLPVVNLAEAKFECIYGRGCDGICCQNGRPGVYPDEVDAALTRICPSFCRNCVQRGARSSRRAAS